MLMHGLLLDQADRRPDADAFVWIDRGRVQTYAQSAQAMREVAAALYAVGVRPGDRVSVVAHNGMDYLNVMFGAWYLGAISAHVSVKFANEFEYYLGDHQPSAIVYTHDLEREIKRAARTLDTAPALVCMDGPQDDAYSLIDIQSAGHPVPAMATDASAGAHLSYTSGTTGQPKGALLAHEPTVTATRAIGERLRITSADRTFAPGAMSSSNPLVANILPEVAVGATLHVMKDWSPEKGYAAIVDRGITLVAANPIMLTEVYEQAMADPDRAVRLKLRAGVSGGGSVAPQLRAAWTRDLGVALVESYGQSELGGFVALGFPEPRAAHDLSQRVGPPLPDKEVRILDDADEPLPIGDVGEICLRGPFDGKGFMLGYWGRPGKTAETLRNGWLHTGDLGVVDADGWITLRGRVSETIAHGGQRWFPRDIEESLLVLPEVSLAALVGPVRDGVRVPVAVVALVDGTEFDAEAARAHLAHTTAYDVSMLEFAAVDELPMTPTGKIAKAQIAASLGD
ncbi:class I adenylate-forming enzyme family protein [Microbacterium sp.]|uniref:class I adenylate-forming enzyme family protein n=1 Tax=Microbacterium sp. TaxID=51671 RepID=UPI003C1B4CF3